MKHSPRYFLLLSFLLSSRLCIYAQTAANDGPGPDTIIGVSLSGLKRTKPSVAEYSLKKFVGQDAGSVDLNDVHGAIVKTGILEPLSILLEDSPGGEGKILVVEVREKWAFFPLPVFFVDSEGSISGGGAFMDANAFGLNDKFILAGLFGTAGWLATIIYQNTPERDHLPGWSVMGMYARQNQRDTDQKKQDIRRYDLDSISASLGIQYPVTDFLNISGSLSFHRRILRDSSSPLNAPEEDVLAIGVSPAIMVTRSHWDGFLSSEQNARLEYTCIIGIDAPTFQLFSLRGVYEKTIVPGFQAELQGGIRYNPQATPLFESSPASVGITILPQTFSGKNFAGASLGLEKYLFKFSHGTLSLLASYQAVYSQGPILGDQFDHGIAGALRFYLSRIAIPALGLGAAYNVRADEFLGSFSLGMSF